MVQKSVDNFGRQVLWKMCWKIWVEELGWEIGWKEWVKNLVENYLEKVVGKIRMKNSVDKFSGKFGVNKCVEQETMLPKTLMTNLVEKMNRIFFDQSGA